MQKWQRNPQYAQRKRADQTTKQIRKNNTFIRCGAFWWTRQPLVQYFVQAIQHTANANDEVAKSAVLSFLRRGCLVAAGSASGFRTVFRGGLVAVCDDEDAYDGDGNGDDFGGADFFVEDGDAEGVGKEGGAVVDGGQVAGCRLVDGYVPTSSCERESACDEGRHFEHVTDGRDLGLARRGV